MTFKPMAYIFFVKNSNINALKIIKFYFKKILKKLI